MITARHRNRNRLSGGDLPRQEQVGIAVTQSARVLDMSGYGMTCLSRKVLLLCCLMAIVLEGCNWARAFE